jgi:hypothetical protein
MAFFPRDISVIDEAAMRLDLLREGGHTHRMLPAVFNMFFWSARA